MKKYLYILSAALLSVSCIKNDLPYPKLVPVIESVEISGAKSVNIDHDAMNVTAVLEEGTDIRHVVVSGITYAEGTEVKSSGILGEHDLTEPDHFTLSTYQDYRWTLTARQKIDRYFNVMGQVGPSYIDEANKRAIAYVNQRVNLSRVVVKNLKLGPDGITTYSKSASELRDFREAVGLTVSVHGRDELWHLFVEQTQTVVEFTGIHPWTKVAWLSANGVAGAENGFRYCEKGSDEWITLSGEDIRTDGGFFEARIDSLKPLTTYECQAFSGSDLTAVEEFTTDDEVQIPNGSFEVYSKTESKNYYSFYDPSSVLWSDKWWDSGNIGSTTVGASYSICNPDTDDKVVGETSSRMDSRYVVIKFAAGNMFSGEFAGLVGVSGGKVNFGRPFTTRPQALRLWLKYKSGVIDHIGSYPESSPVAKGDQDKCQVFVALGDWDYRTYGGSPDCPVQVNTTDRSTFFNPESENVIAYGSYESDETTDGWIQLEIPLEYRNYSVKPTHIIISCAASKLGDYFTGSSESTLWVDGMELIY